MIGSIIAYGATVNLMLFVRLKRCKKLSGTESFHKSTLGTNPATEKPKPRVPVRARHTAIRLEEVEIECKIRKDLHNFGEELLVALTDATI